MISNVQTKYKLDVFIITPDQFLSEIKRIENILPEYLHLSESNLMKIIYKKQTKYYIILYSMNNRIIFSIKMPILPKFSYYILHSFLSIYAPINEKEQFILHMAENAKVLINRRCVVTKYFIWKNINNCILQLFDRY